MTIASPSNDYNIDDVSEIYGQPSFDIRSICPKYAFESCLRCQQNAEYDASLANDVSKTGECCYTNLLKIVIDGFLGSSCSQFFLDI